MKNKFNKKTNLFKEKKDKDSSDESMEDITNREIKSFSDINNVINDTAEKLVEEIEDQNPLDNKEMHSESLFYRIGRTMNLIFWLVIFIFLLYFYLIDLSDDITEIFLRMRVFICDRTSGAFCI